MDVAGAGAKGGRAWRSHGARWPRGPGSARRSGRMRAWPS